MTIFGVKHDSDPRLILPVMGLDVLVGAHAIIPPNPNHQGHGHSLYYTPVLYERSTGRPLSPVCGNIMSPICNKPFCQSVFADPVPPILMTAMSHVLDDPSARRLLTSRSIRLTGSGMSPTPHTWLLTGCHTFPLVTIA